MIIVGDVYKEHHFIEKFKQYYNESKNYNDTELWGLESLFYNLKLDYENDKTIYSEQEIINKVKNLVVIEAHKLHMELFNDYYYGAEGTQLIEVLKDSLEETGNTYLDYVQVGVRREQVVIFISK